jgi:ParB family chromosome partitioning protein
MQEMALVENIQRENLNEMEKACAYEKLLLEFGLSHDDLSQRVGASRSAVTNTLRLLKLPEKLQAMVRRQELSMGHARALLSIEDHARQEALAERVLKEGLSVREVEEASKKHSRSLLRKKPKTDIGNQYDPDTAAVVEKLQYKFGTAVKLCSKPDGGGTVEISYYSPEDLNRILDILL